MDWNEVFEAPGFTYGTEPNDFLREHAGRLESPILCIAEGEGRNATYLATLGLEVHGVDGSSVGLAKARRLADDRGVVITTEVADLADYEFGLERWAGIVSISAHLPPEVRARVHARIGPALRRGGVLLLEAYAPSQLERGTGGPPDRAWLFPIETVKAELGDAFDFEIAHETEREVIEGARHSGLASVTQILAVKR